MDSRDLSRGGDEDGIREAVNRLGKEAAQLFESRRYAECIDVLHQISQMRIDDPKVLHNIVVAEYFRDGCSDPRKILEVLNKVKKSFDNLARTSGEPVETFSNNGSAAFSGSKGSGTTVHQLSASNTATGHIGEYDTSVATHNIAVVLFHLHDYASALQILDSLYQNIEPIDEITALHICLLLLDVALASHDATKAAHVLQHLEKSFGSQGDNGSTIQPHYSHPPVKSSSMSSNSISLDISNSDSASNASGNALVGALSDENYENLLVTLERRPGFSSANDLSKASLHRSVPAVDMKLKLHLYKVRLLILIRNLKAGKREMKQAIDSARGGDSSTALLLKSQLEYARNNLPKSIKLLMPSSSRTESGMPCIVSNNLACIYHQLNKHHISALLFSKALKGSLDSRSEKPLKLSTFSQDKSLLIAYNCGIQQLVCEKPIVAAQCFQKAALVSFNYNRPLLLLRMAECCLLALEKGFLELTRVPNNEVRVHVVGQGKYRKLVVEDEPEIRCLENTAESDGLASSDDQQKPSVQFAQQCLLNALHILDGVELKSLMDSLLCPEEEDTSDRPSPKDSNHRNISVGDSKASNMTVIPSQACANGDARDARGLANSSTTLQGSISMFDDTCRAEKQMIKQAVLAALAYIELAFENPLKALSTADSLLRLSECSSVFIFVGHMYAAEALCRLNRLKEAADHLSIYMSDGINADFPYSEEDIEKWRGKKAVDGEDLSGRFVANKRESGEEIHGNIHLKPAEALGIFYVNSAAVSAMEGDVEMAHQFASKALSLIPNNRQAIVTAVYVDLLLGRSQQALVRLKECRRVRFLASGVTRCHSS